VQKPFMGISDEAELGMTHDIFGTVSSSGPASSLDKGDGGCHVGRGALRPAGLSALPRSRPLPLPLPPSLRCDPCDHPSSPAPLAPRTSNLLS